MMSRSNGTFPRIQKSDLLVAGSIALDTVQTPAGERANVLGGSAVYFATAASFFTKVHLIGVVGKDFPAEHTAHLKKRNIGLSGLQVSEGSTFRWKGSYTKNINEAETLDTQLNVLGTFDPQVPEPLRHVECVFLANLDPDAQLKVLSQMKNVRLMACDTMNLWINIKRPSLEKLLKKVHVFVLNDGEAKLLTGEHNLVKAGQMLKRMGPRYVVVKKGEHGAFLFTQDAKVNVFVTPAYPLEHVVDPTGAGDTFGGGMMGHLSRSHDLWNPKTLRQGIIFGNVMASFTVEDFSLDRLKKLKPSDIVNRYKLFREITEFGAPTPL